MSGKDKGRKWIISLGFSEAQADSFIEFEVPNRKIEALAEVLRSGKILEQPVTEPAPAPEPETVPAPGLETAAPAPDTSEKPSEPKPPDEGKGFGDYLCPQCKVTHRAGSKVHKRHLKLLKG